MTNYMIAPTLVRISLDDELSRQFADLDARLAWKPLTTSLDSCENGKYLYFRVSLKAGGGSETYAGFPTGVPFILTRDAEVKNRKFFLRHWIRKESVDSNAKEREKAQLIVPEHMSVGSHENRLLVRVDIDRPLVAADTFNSHTFATMMFQVVQVDAIIEQRQEVRFAFAIERTVTQEERDVLPSILPNASQANAPKGPSTDKPVPKRSARINRAQNTNAASASSSASPSSAAQSPQPQSRQARTTPMASPRYSSPSAQFMKPLAPMQRMVHPSPMQAPAMRQALMYQRGVQPFGAVQPIRNTMPSNRGATTNMYRHNPYHFVSHQRQVPMQMRQAVGAAEARPAILTPKPSTVRAPPAAARVHNRPLAGTTTGGTPTTTLAPTPPIPVPPPIPNPTSTRAGTIAATNATGVKLSNNPTQNSTPSKYPKLVSKPHYSGIIDNVKGNAHPDVRLWEEHDANDPYEPFFVTDDAKFEEKSKKKVILDHATEFRDRFDHNELFGFPAADFPSYYAGGPDVFADGDEADVELVVQKIPKEKLDFGRRSSFSTATPNGIIARRNNDYYAAVVSACAYNSTLWEERKGLKQWLVEDAERREARSEEEEEDEEGDSMSE